MRVTFCFDLRFDTFIKTGNSLLFKQKCQIKSELIHIKTTLYFNLVGSLVIFLSGCGGGSGESSLLGVGGDSPTPTPVVSTPVPSTPAPSTPVPTAMPEPTVMPTPTTAPSPTSPPNPTGTPDPLPTPNPNNPIVDQCDTTAQCSATYGDAATDCFNSRSKQSVCMCGSSPCSNTTPTPTPVASPTPVSGSGNCKVEGVLQQWHRVNITCSGYSASETDDKTFTDHRFNVTFTQGSKTMIVPGHFAADGDASNSGAVTGDKWRVYFSPPSTGEWRYRVSMRQGDNIAVDASQNAGQAVSSFNGKTGRFDVKEAK